MATRMKPSATPRDTDSLRATFDVLHKLLSQYAPPFRATTGTVKNKPALHLIVPKPVVIPGHYGGTPKDAGLASIILQNDYVGFYYLPAYLDPNVGKSLSPRLMKLLKGRTCFHVKAMDDELRGDIKAALDVGVKFFRARQWL